MKVKFIILTVVIGLVGCSQPDGKPAFTSEIYIKGVTYYAGGHHLTPAFKQDGTLYTCEVGK